eukprot:g613.t1
MVASVLCGSGGVVDVAHMRDALLKAKRRARAAAQPQDRMALAAARVRRDLGTARSSARARVDHLVKAASFRRAMQPGANTMAGALRLRTQVAPAAYGSLYAPN